MFRYLVLFNKAYYDLIMQLKKIPFKLLLFSDSWWPRSFSVLPRRPATGQHPVSKFIIFKYFFIKYFCLCQFVELSNQFLLSYSLRKKSFKKKVKNQKHFWLLEASKTVGKAPLFLLCKSQPIQRKTILLVYKSNTSAYLHLTFRLKS